MYISFSENLLVTVSPAFLYSLVGVSLHGYSGVFTGRRRYPWLETLVPMRGNCSFPPGNGSSDVGNGDFNCREKTFDAWCGIFLLIFLLYCVADKRYLQQYLQRYLQRYNCLSVSLLFRFCCRWQMFFYFSNFIVGTSTYSYRIAAKAPLRLGAILFP